MAAGSPRSRTQLAAVAVLAHGAPALAGCLLAAAPPVSGSPTARPTAGLCTDLRRRAAPLGTPACSTCRARTGPRDVLHGRRAGGAATRRWPGRSPSGDTRSRCTATATATSCGPTAPQVCEDLAGRRRDLRGHRSSDWPVPPADGIATSASLLIAAGVAGGRCRGRHWGRDWRRQATPSSIAVLGSGWAAAGAGRACCTTPTTMAPTAPGRGQRTRRCPP